MKWTDCCNSLASRMVQVQVQPQEWVTSTEMGLSARETITTWANGKAMAHESTAPLPWFTSACTCFSIFLIWLIYIKKKKNYCTCTDQQNLVSHHTMEPRFSTNWMLHWTPHVTSSFSPTSADDTVSLTKQQGWSVVKEAKNSSKYTAGHQLQEETQPSGTRGCPFFQHFGGLQATAEAGKPIITTETKEKTGECTHSLLGEEQNLFSCPVDSERLKNAFNPPVNVKCKDKMRAD